MFTLLGMNPLSSSSSSSSSVDAALQQTLALRALTALPAGLANASHASAISRRRSHAKKSKQTPLASEGQCLGRFFNPVAGRPYPNFSKLDQTIRVVDTLNSQAFLSTSTTVPTGATLAVTLQMFTNYSEYTNCFDQYRIEQLEVWLEPSATQEAVTNALVTCVDLDDVNTVSGPTVIQDKQGALVGNGIQGRYHRWRPHVAVAEFGGTFTGYGNIPATWIDTASPAVQHYGFKAGAASTPGGSLNYNLSVRAVISFRAPGL
jgi:hypothetical protein